MAGDLTWRCGVCQRPLDGMKDCPSLKDHREVARLESALSEAREEAERLKADKREGT